MSVTLVIISHVPPRRYFFENNPSWTHDPRIRPMIPIARNSGKEVLSAEQSIFVPPRMMLF
jgi:hypothetical protein